MPKQATWAALRRSNSFYFSLFRNLGSDLELLESIERESLTSEVESERELEIEKEAIQNQRSLHRQSACR